MAKLRTLTRLVRTTNTSTTRRPPRLMIRSTAHLSSNVGVLMLSLVLAVSVRLSTRALDAARQSPSIACTLTTSSNCVMVEHRLISLTGNAYAHRITSSRRSRLELEGFETRS